MTAVLTLPLKGIYFDQIASGEKREEYRLATDFWIKRLAGRAYDRVVLTRGYPKGGGIEGKTRLTRAWAGCRQTIMQHPHFGPSPVEVFAIDVTAIVDETWLDAPGYAGRYQVSSLGRIRSLSRVEAIDSVHGPYNRPIPGRILKPSPNADGYLHVSLRVGGKLKLVRLHRLVALAFHGPGNTLHKEVAHLDNDRANARADNLKWVSRTENHFHKRLHGTHMAGEKHPNAKLTEVQARAIKASRKPLAEIAAFYGISPRHVSDIRTGRRWGHIQSPKTSHLSHLSIQEGTNHGK